MSENDQPREYNAVQGGINVVTVNSRGIIISTEQRPARYFTEDLGNGITLEMAEIPGGSFLMGSLRGEGRENERPQHQVTIQPFYIGKYPITQTQWEAVARLPQINCELDPNLSEFKGANRPVERVNWVDAVEFCQRLKKATQRPYRLPSEAEWEYACRGGTTTPFHFGETITTELANYNGNYTYGGETGGIRRGQTTEVGSFGVANEFGLYDMHGNVWEWCEDYMHDSYEGAPTDGSAWLDGNHNHSRVMRGGSWYNTPGCGRCAYRCNFGPNSRTPDVGFRVVWKCPLSVRR